MTLPTPAPVPYPLLSRRDVAAGGLAALGSLFAAACGSGGSADATAPTPAPTAAPAPTDAPTPPPTFAPTPAPTPAPPSPPGTIASLVVRGGAVAGLLPYTATVLALRGQVPAGSTLTSTEDAQLRASVLASHDDGSAALMVVAGETSMTVRTSKTLFLQAAAAPTETALGAPRVAQLLNNVTVTLPGYGSAVVSDFGAPERIWWANSKLVCARYRVAASAAGSTALEAVIDVTAYAAPHDRALVEVVVENAKVASGTPAKPAAASYSGATVSVNGVVVATVNGTGPVGAEGNHAAFRAWYAKAWVGGDPDVGAAMAHADLQKHPLLWKMDQASTANLSGYAADAYQPWSTGRHRATGMGGAGDHPSIGPLPLWEARALQSGDAVAWRATEASALAALSYNINYRDSATGLVPTFAAIGSTRAIASGTWPSQSNAADAACWETAHCPAVGLMGFIGRPSPVFIEIAQKAAMWNGAWSRDSTPGWTAGLFGYWYQVRGRAWGLRSLVHAGFITPASMPWRAASAAAIATNVAYLDGWRTDAKQKLGTLWDYSIELLGLYDHQSGTPGFQHPIWEDHYLMVELHKAANAGLLGGASQAALTALANWMVLGPVRWVNEQPNGGWRYIPYSTTIGSDGATISSQLTWNLERNRAGNHADATSGARGPWMVSDAPATAYSQYTTDNTAGAYYPSYFWAALAVAVERGVSGAAQAWLTVNGNVTNLATWRRGFGNDPRWGVSPRT